VQELVHIRAMIPQLEHLIHDNDTGPAMPVTSPDYWCARIDRVVAANLPPASSRRSARCWPSWTHSVRRHTAVRGMIRSGVERRKATPVEWRF